MKVYENIIITDTTPGENWEFDRIISSLTGLVWRTVDGGLRYKIANVGDRLKRYWNFVYFPFVLFLKRKKIDNIIAWQQYYGLIYILYCMIFHVKKQNYCLLMTFIYVQRKGLWGKIQYHVVRSVLNSPYLDHVLVYSENEREYYQKLFHLDDRKISNIHLGLEDLTKGIQSRANSKFVLSAGRSNRDYSFVFDALDGSEYDVKIVCDALAAKNKSNIQIYNHTYYHDFFQMLADCYCVLIALDDPEISSGQLVIIQAMQFGKPIIVTESKTVREYLQSGTEGFIIPKDKRALREKLKILYEDKETYRRMSQNARRSYEKNFSMEALGQQVAKCFLETGGRR